MQDFGKGGGGGGPGNCSVLKHGVFRLHTQRFFPLYEVWRSPKRRGGGPGSLDVPILAFDCDIYSFNVNAMRIYISLG